MADLPPPPTPADANLQHFASMPLEVSRLRDSGIAHEANPEAFRCAVLLWCAAWHQVPAGSLPADDVSLSRLSGLGRDLRTWRRLREGALRGFRPFSDGRLYHQVVSQKVIESWNSTRLTAWSRACDRVRKENKSRSGTGQPSVQMPEKPPALPLEWPAESAWFPAERPAENALKEGKKERRKEVISLGAPSKGGPLKNNPLPLPRARALRAPHATTCKH